MEEKWPGVMVDIKHLVIFSLGKFLGNGLISFYRKLRKLVTG